MHTRTAIVETELGRFIIPVEAVFKESYNENRILQAKHRIVLRWKPSVYPNKLLDLRVSQYESFSSTNKVERST